MKKIIKTICFDIDNVLCDTFKSNYKSSKPNLSAIKKVNDLYDRGYKIILFTARFMGRTKNNEKNIFTRFSSNHKTIKKMEGKIP